MAYSCISLLIFTTLMALSVGQDDDLHLTILHTSDVTSSFEQFNTDGDKCTDDEDARGECLGGVPRRGTVINGVRNERDDINVLLLDGGDQFVGEWFNVYKGEATSYFMNRLGYDAMTFGNLEFALGPDGLASFLEDIDFDAVSANLNVTNEPSLQGLFSKSVIKDIDGKPVGIVGYTVQRTNVIANVGDAYFEDVIDSVQKEVDSLTSQGVDIIIVLGHSYGRVVDGNEALEIAKNISGVDIVVIGGALLFQYPNNGCPFIREDEIGAYVSEPYPKVVTPNDDPDGEVLIIHGYIDARYIGRLNVVFDEDGKITEWYGNPIRLDKNIEQDPELLEEIKEYAEGVENTVNRLLGRTLVKLAGNVPGDNACRKGECNLGNLITDAMVWNYVTSFDDKVWNNVSIGVQNGGAIRGSIERGEVRLGDINRVLPFASTFDILDLYGRHIKEMLEHAVARYEDFAGTFLQMSGMKVTYDLTGEPFVDRVSKVVVLCTECRVPKYFPLEEDKLYRIIVPSFIGGGGDGYDVLKENALNYMQGEIAQDVVAKYIEQFSPIYTGIGGRIKFIEMPPSAAPELSTIPDVIDTSSSLTGLPVTSPNSE
ncbi:snake venom 5'-nucleotidase-like [Amphiura filiformis]|uniref:snake venom 5'-nucleotidase-like n=1 Tax=Amphiura filiformis TaxID=82378 RepID=UPI003B20CEDC